MDADIAARLIEINRDFYTQFGGSFSATRHRIQPGVRRLIGMLNGEESILDLGCGNGELARELAVNQLMKTLEDLYYSAGSSGEENL